MLRVVLLVLLTMFLSTSFAKHEPLQRFPLGKPIPESAVTICSTAELPVELNTLMAAGKEEDASRKFTSALMFGQCMNLRNVHVVYRRQVHKLEDGEDLYTVYEGAIDGLKVFVPMRGFLHEGAST